MIARRHIFCYYQRMNLFNFDPASFLSFTLTFMRISLILFLLPFFGGENIPAQVKAALCLVLTLALWPANAVQGIAFPAGPFNLALLLFGEAVLGLGLGLMVQFVFAGMQLGGQIIGFQMGFSMISLMDPSSNQQMVITSFLLHSIGLCIFLLLDGHLLLVKALVSSFSLVEPGHLLVEERAMRDMIRLAAGMFTLALKIAGPIVTCLFMVELALAMMARVAPQMNLMVLGFPVKIGVGFFFFGVMFSLIGLYLNDFIRGISPMLNNFMRSVGGG
ncbi:MAG: flagellar biosynthetic protein FliR [Deltaproteobacteria bacterium]|jgi:flagellar biosynthetic protein FliR|nr:flagellar biosynthetic protein FliR [Deltaproteobacteria bacterium]